MLMHHLKRIRLTLTISQDGSRETSNGLVLEKHPSQVDHTHSRYSSRASLTGNAQQP
jgi:hypothetical protein